MNQAASCDLKELVNKFIPESIGKEIEKATAGIFPLQNVYVRKVKILKAPKFDLGKLMEVFVLYSRNIMLTAYQFPFPTEFLMLLVLPIPGPWGLQGGCWY